MSGDGILVFDRNNNSLIDSGRELFGDSTIKTDGITAQHGFDVLSDLDDNHDGRIDALDTHFHDLKVA